MEVGISSFIDGFIVVDVAVVFLRFTVVRWVVVDDVLTNSYLVTFFGVVTVGSRVSVSGGFLLLLSIIGGNC